MRDFVRLAVKHASNTFENIKVVPEILRDILQLNQLVVLGLEIHKHFFVSASVQWQGLFLFVVGENLLFD